MQLERAGGVSFVCHPYHRGGVTRWMLDAAAEIRRRGRPVWFIAPEPQRPFASGSNRPTMASLIRELPADNRPSLIAPRVGTWFELGTQSYRSSVYARAVASNVPQGVPVIVSDDEAVWAGAARMSRRNPLIGVLHSDEPKYYALAREYRQRMAACVAVSKRIADTAAREANIPTHAIPCGVPIRECAPDSRSSEGRAELIWVGRIEQAQKRVMDLAEIAIAIRTRGVQFHLTIVGDGPEREQLASEMEARGLDDVVKFVGWQNSNEVWSRLCASDVLVLPSNFEGMPVVVMEALSAGCSVVASRVSGLEDVDEESHRAVLLTHGIGDTESAATLIIRTLQERRHERRAAARDLAQERFSIERCIAQYEQVLDLVDRGSSRAVFWRPGALVTGMASFPLALARATRRRLRRQRSRGSGWA